MRWIKRIVLGLIVLVVLVVASGLIFIHTDTGRTVIRDQLVDKLADTFTGKVSIGRIEGSPFGTLTAHDVVIDDPEGTPAIAIGRVDVQLELAGLVRKKAVIDRLVASDVAVVARRTSDGTLSLSHLIKPGPKSDWHVIIQDLEVHHGRIAVTGVGAEAMHFDQLEVAGSLDHTIDTLSADLRLSARWRERAIPLSATASVRNSGEDWSIPALFADVDGAYVRAGGIRIAGNAFGGNAVIDASRASFAKLGIANVPDLRLAVSAVPDGPKSQLAIAGTIDREPVTGNLALDIGAQRVSGTVSTTGLSVGRLAKLQQQPDLRVAGALQLDVHATEQGAAGSVAPDLKIAGLPQPELRDLAIAGSSTFDLAKSTAKLPIGTAELHANASARGVPATSAMLSLRSDGITVAGSINATNAAATASVQGEAKIDDIITLTESRIAIAASDLARATGGLSPVHGSVTAQLTARGQVSPAPNLAVAGSIDGRRLRAADATIGSLRVAIDARRIPDRPTGRFDLLARQITRGNLVLREVSLTAADRADGKIAATLRSRPKADPWLVEADALVTPGRDITVDLTRHLIRTADNVEWTGHTGRLTITRSQIALADLRSTSQVGAVAADASYQRLSGDLAAKVSATGISLAALEPQIKGTVDANADVSRRAGRFHGTIDVHGKGLARLVPDRSHAPPPAPHVATATKQVEVTPKPADATTPNRDKAIGTAANNPAAKKPARTEGSPPPVNPGMEATARVELDGSQVRLAADVGAPTAGNTRVNAELVGPPDITDVAAWKRLGRQALRGAQLQLAGVDIAKTALAVGAPDVELAAYRGTVDGTIQIADGIPSGKLAIRKLVTPELRGMGAANIDVDVVQTGDLIVPTIIAKLDTIGSLTARAELRPPDRLFDPAAWHRDALRRATLSAKNLAIDPGRLDMLRLYWTGRGRASIDAELLPQKATAAIALRDLRGSPVAKPVDLDLALTVDRKITATLRGASTGTKLLDGSATIPVSLDQLVADPQQLRTAPISGTLTSTAPAEVVLGLFGRSEVVGGTIEANARVGGTLAAPQVAASITGRDLEVPPGPGNKPIQTVKSIVIDGSWRDGTVLASLDALEDKGSLRASIVANPDAPKDAQISLTAKSFDLIPILAFAPGPAGGAAGRLDANVTIKGIDPRTAQVAGELHLRDGRIPIAPAVGTLRRATIDAKVNGKDVALNIEGGLGDGKIKGTGSVSLDGVAPTGGKLQLALRKVSPIGVVEPIVDADVKVDMRRETYRWVADVDVRNASVEIPSSRHEALYPPGAPPDMVFESGRRITNRPLDRGEPTHPLIVAKISIAPTKVVSEELRGTVRGNLTVSASGDTLGLLGVVETDGGDLDLFGRRYRVERASVRFDGTLDPLLDVAISHDFPEVTTTTEIRGRASRPKLIMTSDPGTYSQGQLLGFLLGGEPAGDPGDSRDRATAAGTSYLANRIGGYVKDVLPIDLDVLRYEHATSTSSAAITVGTWIRHELFLAYRRRLEARPDENAGEGELEYWLSRRIVIEGVVGDRNRDSVDLLWRKRY